MKGWSFVGSSRKAHYFDIPEGKTGGNSLCGSWMLLRANPDYLEDNNHNSSSNCASCKRKLKKIHPELFESQEKHRKRIT